MVSVSAGDLASLGSSLTIGTRLIHLSLLIYAFCTSRQIVIGESPRAPRSARAHT
jgi:hypothetical protein